MSRTSVPGALQTSFAIAAAAPRSPPLRFQLAANEFLLLRFLIDRREFATDRIYCRFMFETETRALSVFHDLRWTEV